MFPVIRLELLILYIFAALSKLNPQFFNVDISCATIKLFEINQVLPILPTYEWFLKLNPYLTFLFEISIPIFLLVKRTRILGVILGFVFHFAVGLKHTGFTLLMFSLYSLFLPDQIFKVIEDSITKLKARLSTLIKTKNKYLFILFKIIVFMVVLKIITFMMGGTDIRTFVFSRQGFYLVSFSIFFSFFMYYLIKFFKSKNNSEVVSFLPNQTILILLPIILFTVGLFPYLGIKNIQVFTMFSNLSTENGKTNHLFIPASIQVFDNLSDIVEIKSSNILGLDKFSDLAVPFPLKQTQVLLPKSYVKYQKSKDNEIDEKFYYGIPYLLLSNIITELSQKGVKNINLEFIRYGRPYSILNAEEDAELSNASLIQRKLLGLRAVPINNIGACMW